MGKEPADAIPINALLFTVFESISEVFLLCLAGYILASTGVTDKATQRKLNVINVSLFTPALLFSKVAFSLTPSKLREMWIIPLGFVFITGVSALVAWTLSKMFRLKKSQTAFAICAAMFQNSNSLPIALVQSLVSVVPGLKWGSHDSKDQMLGRALTYLVLYSTLGMVLRWSWGVKLLAGADDEEDANATPAAAPGSNTPVLPPPGPILPSHVQSHNLSIMSPDVLNQDDPFASPERMQSFAAENRTIENSRGRSGDFAPSSLPMSTSVVSQRFGSRNSSPAPRLRRGSGAMSRSSSQNRRPRPPSRADSGRELLGLPEQPRHTLVDLEEDSSESEAEDADEWDNGRPSSLRRRTTPPHSPSKRVWLKTKRVIGSAWEKFQSFMTVPTWAALISIFIALIPPLQAQVSAVRPFVAAVKSAGQCSIPVTLVVLGAFFYTPKPITLEEDQPTTLKGKIEAKIRGLKGYISLNSNEDKPKAYEGENRAVFVAVISRMVVTPLVFLPVIALLARYDWFPAAEDPVFILCAVLLVSSPPALTLAQLTQAASGDAFERLISKTISWSYAVLTPPLTLVYVVIGLVFSKL